MPVNLPPSPRVWIVMRRAIPAALLPAALAACGSASSSVPPSAAYKACTALAAWEKAIPGGAVPSGNAAALFSADAAADPQLQGALAQWEKDASAGNPVALDVVAVDGTCDGAGVSGAVPQG